METNRTASFPAEAPHKPNNRYFYAQVQAIPLSVSFAFSAYLLAHRGPTSGWTIAMFAMTAAQVVAFAVQLFLARRASNRRVAEYRKKNPDVQLTQGP